MATREHSENDTTSSMLLSLILMQQFKDEPIEILELEQQVEFASKSKDDLSPSIVGLGVKE